MPKRIAWITVSVLVFAIFLWPTPYDLRHPANGSATRTNRFTGVVQISTSEGWKTPKEAQDAEVLARTAENDRIEQIVRPMLAAIKVEVVPNPTTVMRFDNISDIGPGTDTGGLDPSPCRMEYWLYDTATGRKTKFLCYGTVGQVYNMFSGGIQLVRNGYTIIRYADVSLANSPEVTALPIRTPYLGHVVWTINSVDYMNKTININPPFEITGDVYFKANGP